DVAATARRKAQGKTTSVISPLALEAVRRIDALFEIERSINGESAERRRAVRQESSAPLIADLEVWLREQRAKLSRGNDLAKAMDYLLKRWPAFTRFLEDGRGFQIGWDPHPDNPHHGAVWGIGNGSKRKRRVAGLAVTIREAFGEGQVDPQFGTEA